MHFNLAHSMAILARAPGVLRSLLQDLPAEWQTVNEGEQTWSPFDVVGHLIHGERTDWVPRLKIILEFGEAQPFQPFDRFAQMAESKDRSLAELLDSFAQLREANLRELREMNLGADELRKKGTHPELGVVSAEQLLATWVVHDLDHLGQVTRTMAKQYGEAVGPWRAYLSILK